jgi:endonuclease YncB( thermonuclease family)
MTFKKCHTWMRIGNAFVPWIAKAMPSQQWLRKERWARRLCISLLISGAGLCPALAGDALYGTIVNVSSAEVVMLKSATQQYVLRIRGIEIPTSIAKEAEKFVSKLVLGRGKKVGAHLFYRAKNGEMLSRLYAKDTNTGKVQDVGLELVRAGLAVPQKDYDYKYGELSAAQRDAKTAKLGVWN